jgi:hypothetical protein
VFFEKWFNKISQDVFGRVLKRDIERLPELFNADYQQGVRTCDGFVDFCLDVPSKRGGLIKLALDVALKRSWLYESSRNYFFGSILRSCGNDRSLKVRCVDEILEAAPDPNKDWAAYVQPLFRPFIMGIQSVFFAQKALESCGDRLSEKELCAEIFLSDPAFLKKAGADERQSFFQSFFKNGSPVFIGSVLRACRNDRVLISQCIGGLLADLSFLDNRSFGDVQPFFQMLLKESLENGEQRTKIFDALAAFIIALDPKRFDAPFPAVLGLLGKTGERHLTVARSTESAAPLDVAGRSNDPGQYISYVTGLIRLFLAESYGDEELRGKACRAAFSVFPDVVARKADDAGPLLKEFLPEKGGNFLSLLSGLAGKTDLGDVIVFSNYRAAENPFAIFVKRSNGVELDIPNCFGEKPLDNLRVVRQKRALGHGNGHFRFIGKFMSTARKTANQPEGLPMIAEAFLSKVAIQGGKREEKPVLGKRPVLRLMPVNPNP